MPPGFDIPGKLIAVEGIDGSGKSTQIHLLKRWLELRGYKVFLTEWNSSRIVRRAARRGQKRQLLTPTTFSLIHCTDFADRYDRYILPLLHAGGIVLADQYVFTAFARDTVRGCNEEWLRALYSYAAEPDITFYFDAPLDVTLARIRESRSHLKYHEAGMDMGFSTDPYESFRIFQGRIQTEYERLLEEFGFTVVDATGPPEKQQTYVRRVLGSRIDLASHRWQLPAPFALAHGVSVQHANTVISPAEMNIGSRRSR